MTLAVTKFISKNRTGLFIGGAIGFLASKILYGPGGLSREALIDMGRSAQISEFGTLSKIGLIDSWLSSYDLQTVIFIKATILLVLIFMLIGGFVDSKVK